MIPFETDRLIVRRWEARDRARFHSLNSDPAVMRYFPHRCDREQSDAVMAALNVMVDTDGLTLYALESKADGRLVGMTGLTHVDPALDCAPGIEIGWILLESRWGHGYASEAAAGCLDRAFGELGLDEVVSLCVAANEASLAAMVRLGFSPDGEFDHPGIDAETHPDLVRHKLYRLTKADWEAMGPTNAAPITQ